jgi:hypothetical protein
MGISMKLAPSVALFACLLASSAAISGCAADFDGDEPEAPVVGIEPQGSPHLKGGKRSAPSFEDLGLVLKGGAAVSGLGNYDVDISMSAVGQPLSTCTNPAGATQPPGQNPAEVTLTGSQHVSASDIKNGNLSFSLQTGAPDPIVAGAPGCPNTQWTQEITDVTFSRATITVVQNGATVLSLSCTFSPSTANGAVPAGNVTCTSS